MKKKIFIILIIISILIFVSCSGFSQNLDTYETLESSIIEATFNKSTSFEESNNESSVETESSKESISKVEKLIKSMTLEEKIGQLFIISPYALQNSLTTEQINNSKSLEEQMKETLKKYPVGGIIFFGKDITTPIQLIEFINDMQQHSKIPLFISVDEEGGIVSRIANSTEFDVPKFKSMQEIGKTGDSKNAYNVGFTIGSYLKQYGFNVNFAPVADINTNPKNIVIGNRSFGSDPTLVGEMVAAEILGLHEAGIITCVKHFPGHGDTQGDTHDGFVSIQKTWDELLQCELLPFIEAINSSTDMIMISHITTPNITSDGLPSSLSYEILNKKLREELNYNGIIITDSMLMGAISQKYSSDESAVKAVLAGVDIILMPENYIVAYNGIYNAINNGIISEERINESVLRILNLKEQYNILE